jgi:predicted TIM-barrel enzyme
LAETLEKTQLILQQFKDQIDKGIPIIGAGAGTGISAKFEEAGGVDLIVLYNSGRFRMAGRGSLAGLLPFADANAVVLDMANEVLPVCFFFLFLSILLFLEGNIVQLLNSVQVLFTSGG